MARKQKTTRKPPQRKAAKRKRQRRPPAKPRKILMVKVPKKWKAGAGRKPGTKNKVPSSTRRVFAALCQEIADESIKDVKAALYDGITSGPGLAFHYLRLFRDSLDGPPTTGLDIRATFKDDELQAASRDLDRKMNSLLKHVQPATHPVVSETPSA
jgi:hypothetical protein